MNDNQSNLYLTALVQSLEMYFKDFQQLKFPSCAQIGADEEKIQVILEAEKWCLPHGVERIFDPSNPTPLRPIFDDIYLDQYDTTSIQFTSQPRGKSHTFFPFQALALKEDTIFPISQHPAKQAYDKLWGDFKLEFEKLKNLTSNAYTFTTSFIYLLKKYCTCIPVSRQLDSVSLFEFLKVRASISECLWRTRQEAGITEPVLMVAVGVSGIQDFIYNVASAKAARSLKGRSFYLQLLMESVIQKIIRHQDIVLTEGQVLYASGGKMYMFLPNLAPVRQALADIEKELTAEIFKQYKTGLYVSFEQRPINKALCLTPGEPWEGLERALNNRKWRKFEYRSNSNADKSNLLVELFNEIFKPQPEGFDDAEDKATSKKRVCQVTGNMFEIKDNELEQDFIMNYPLQEGEEPVYVEKIVKHQKKLGDYLQTADYFTTVKDEDKSRSKKSLNYVTNPINLGILHYLKNESDIANEYRKINSLPSFHNSLVRQYNSTNFLDRELVTGKNAAYGFAFYGGNQQACKMQIGESGSEEPVFKDYEELAGYSSDADKGKGFHRLGVLRMDVDGLGKIFAAGMKGQLACFPAYATLSAQLDLFFSGYLNEIRNARDDFKEFLNILYAGGDDLFVVGRWDLTIEFARLIREGFKSLTGGMDAPGISGGLALIGAKFPIAKGAAMAGDAEKAAKNIKLQNRQKQKDGFGFLGEVIGWEEFSKVEKLKNQLVAFHKRGDISSGFLYQFMRFKRIKDFNLYDPSKSPDYSFKWRSVYYLSKVADKFKNMDNSAEVRKFLKECSVNLVLYDREYDRLALAAKWASLETRHEETEKYTDV